MPFSFRVLLTFILIANLHAETVFRRSMDRVPSMDPALSSSLYAGRAVRLVYETLLDIDYTARPYQLIPLTAAALPTLSQDRKTIEITLSPSAQFHPDACFGFDGSGHPRGRSVTSADVVFSFKRLADAKLSSSGAWLVLDSIEGMRAFHEASKEDSPTDYLMPVSGLQAIAPNRIRIRLTRPMHQFLWFLAMPYTAIIPHEAVTHYGAKFGLHPVGSGPYQLTTWRQNHEMVFRRVPAWPGWLNDPTGLRQTQPFDKIIYRVMDDVSTQWLCFLANEIDFLGEISRDNWDAVMDSSGTLSKELADRNFTLHAMPALEVAYVGINMEDPLLGKNRALRQALNCAFDHDAWARFLNNRVIPCNSPVPPGVAGRIETPLPYATNEKLARKLLKEAGYPDGIDPKTGRRLTLTIDLGRTSQDIRESTELMVSFYAKVGISLIPNYHNWPTFLRKIAQRQSQLFRIGWVGDYPDAENFLQLFYSKNRAPGPNRCNYANPVFDKCYEDACEQTVETKRNQCWIEAQKILQQDCPWIFLHYRKAFSLCGPRVKNYKPSDFPFGSERHLRTSRESETM